MVKSLFVGLVLLTGCSTVNLNHDAYKDGCSETIENLRPHDWYDIPGAKEAWLNYCENLTIKYMNRK